MIDLHTHSTHSDGRTTVAANVDDAVRAGLDGMAVTDHDTLAGWDEGASACAAAGIELVPGVELSCEVDGASVHVLGLWVDRGDPALVAELARLRGERDRRAREMVARLEELGVPVGLDAVRAHAGSAPVGRPHVAAALVDAGHVADHAAAFTELIGDDGPAYVPKRALHPVDAVALLRAAGGAAVLAHPGQSSPVVTSRLVSAMARGGLGGIEAHHAAHTEDARMQWSEVARELDLVVTGGSDHHGDTVGRTGRGIGSGVTHRVELARLREDYAGGS